MPFTLLLVRPTLGGTQFPLPWAAYTDTCWRSPFGLGRYNHCHKQTQTLRDYCVYLDRGRTAPPSAKKKPANVDDQKTSALLPVPLRIGLAPGWQLLLPTYLMKALCAALAVRTKGSARSHTATTKVGTSATPAAATSCSLILHHVGIS